MPPKISLISGKRRKAENDLAKTAPSSGPSGPPKPYVLPMFGTSKPYTLPVFGSAKPYTPPLFGNPTSQPQDSAKRLRPSYSPSPASNTTSAPNIVPNPFRRGNLASTTTHTPPKESLFAKNSKKNDVTSNVLNGTPNSSQTSTTSGPTSSQGSVHTPPKVSLFNKKKNIPPSDGQNSAPSSSHYSNSSKTSSGPSQPSSLENQKNGHNQNRFPNPFRKEPIPHHDTAGPTSSPKITFRLNAGRHGSASITTSSSSSSQSTIQLSANDTAELATLLEYYLEGSPPLPSGFVSPSFLDPETSSQSPTSTDRTISNHSEHSPKSWSAFTLSHSEEESISGYLSALESLPEPDLPLSSFSSTPWVPSPALVADLRAADEQELRECKEKVGLVKMQLIWATYGGCESEAVKGLGRGIEKLKRRGRNLERVLGLRDDYFEEEFVEDKKSEDDDTDIEELVRGKQTQTTVGVMPEKLHLRSGRAPTQKHVHFGNLGKTAKEYEKQRTAQSKRNARRFEDDDEWVMNKNSLRGRESAKKARILPPRGR